jgi:predicted GIY-YIG superfamily endonuclease
MKKKKPYGWVYVIINNISGKKYIGASMTPRVRWSWHKNRAMYLCEKTPTQLHLDMYEMDIMNFTFQKVVPAYSESSLRRFEKMWVKKLDTSNPEKGYNINKNYYQCAEETRELMGAARPNIKYKSRL